jgi:AraC-like DNA-binding protein
MPIPAELYKRIVAGKIFIDEHYEQSIDLDQISRKACLSRYHFHRLFRQVYKITPHRYLTKKRIEKAKVMLALNMPVTEVCNEIGFESAGSFSVLFKKEIGFAPQYYRNLAYKKKMELLAEPKTAIPNCYLARFEK